MLKYMWSTLVVTVVIAACAFPVFAQSKSWNEVFDGQGRFAILNQFDGGAVLDRETGLVWEQAPLAETVNHYVVASRRCIDLKVGNRRGWRLPSIQEIASLTDAAESNPTLTAGHPFVNVDLEHFYWTSTESSDYPGLGWSIRLADGRIGRSNNCGADCGGLPKQELAVWCVRGGAGPNVQ